jgi:ACS family hexuronate transporter-like MFS transporter
MDSSAASPPGQPRSSHMRWIICGLLFWVTTANYVDRGVFGNLAPEMPTYLRLADKVQPAAVDAYWNEHSEEVLAVHAKHPHAEGDAKECEECRAFMKARIARKSWDEDYWNMQVAFSAAYALSMLLMGRLMDVVGLRFGFVFACGLWTLASLLHMVAPEIGGWFGNAVIGFFICRVLLALGEGGNFPAAIKTIAHWFPKSERALATGFLNCGSNFGGMLVPWALPFIVAQSSLLTIGGITVGWRVAFLITACIDLCWIVAWLAIYREPQKHPRVNAAELAHIQGDTVEPTVKIPWRRLLPHRQTWAFVCAKFLTDGFWWFYLFGAPDFFSKKFDLTLEDRKYVLMLIYLVADVGAVGGGWLSGRFMRRGWTVNRARKTTLFICSLMVVPVFYSGLTDSKWTAAALITLAAAGHQAWSSNLFSVVGDMFPRQIVGSVTGFGGMISTLGTMLLMFVTGQILKLTGEYLEVFIMASLAYPLAVSVLHLLAPKLEAAELDEPKPVEGRPTRI